MRLLTNLINLLYFQDIIDYNSSMKIFVNFFLTLLLIQGLNTQASNENIVSITGHPDYPPVIWHSKKDDKLKGVAVEATETFLKELDYKVKNRPIATWARSLKEVSEGNVDIILPPYLTKPREKQYLYPQTPFMMDETVLFIRKDSNLKFTKLSDLRAYKGAAIINDSFGDEFDQYNRKVLKIKRLTKTEQCFRFLLKGRTDYVVAGKSAGIAVMAQMGVDDKIQIHSRPVIQTGMYLGASLKSKKNINKIIEHFEKRTLQWKKEGKFKELEEKYFRLYLKENAPNKSTANYLSSQ